MGKSGRSWDVPSASASTSRVWVGCACAAVQRERHYQERERGGRQMSAAPLAFASCARLECAAQVNLEEHGAELPVLSVRHVGQAVIVEDARVENPRVVEEANLPLHASLQREAGAAHVRDVGVVAEDGGATVVGVG